MRKHHWTKEKHFLILFRFTQMAFVLVACKPTWEIITIFFKITIHIKWHQMRQNDMLSTLNHAEIKLCIQSI